MTTNLKSGPKISSKKQGLLLDRVPKPHSAWSFRRLTKDYNGPCIEYGTGEKAYFINDLIEDSTFINDNTKSRVNTRIKVWHDQIGSNNFEQSTSTLQPYLTLLQADNQNLTEKDYYPRLFCLYVPLDNSFMQVPTSNGTYKFMHDGTPWFMTIVFVNGSPFQAGDNMDPNRAFPIINTGGFSTVNIGYSFVVDDRAAASRNDAIYTDITRGVSGSFVMNQVLQDVIRNQNLYLYTDQLTPTAAAASRSKIRIDKSDLYQTSTATAAVSSANSTYNLTILRLNTSAGPVGTQSIGGYGRIAELIIWDQDMTNYREEIEEDIRNHFMI
jgi:hypothetical protein